MTLKPKMESKEPCRACIYDGVVSLNWLRQLTKLGYEELCEKHKRQFNYYVKTNELKIPNE